MSAWKMGALAMPDLFEILHAWAIMFLPTDEQRARADSRAKVCSQCDQMEYMHLSSTRSMHMCKACLCPITAKVYSPKGKEGCPLQKWED